MSLARKAAKRPNSSDTVPTVEALVLEARPLRQREGSRATTKVSSSAGPSPAAMQAATTSAGGQLRKLNTAFPPGSQAKLRPMEPVSRRNGRAHQALHR